MNKVAAMALAITTVGSFFIAIDNAEARPYWKTRVNHRQTRQQNRIFNGVSNGSLTRHETKNLEKREANLAATEWRYRHSGGGLSKTEAAKLEHRQDNISDSIYKQKHDGQTQGQ